MRIVAASTYEAVLHPDRLRILMEFAGGGGRTAADLQAGLRDVSAATLYRHLAMLSAAGVLSVRATRRVRGAEEKTYDLAVSPLLSMKEVGREPALFLKVVTTFAALLLGDFNRYARRMGRRKLDPLLRAYALDLTDAEFRELSGALTDVFARAAGKVGGQDARGASGKTKGRRRRRFYLGALPEVESP